VQPRTRLIREGAPTPGLFLLLCGEAEVLRGAKRLAALGPGDVFGEMSLLRGAPAMGSVDTCTRCWVLALPRKDFQALSFAYPQVLSYVSDLAQRRSTANSHR
jgi:CRP-like cAMP-binding protein